MEIQGRQGLAWLELWTVVLSSCPQSLRCLLLSDLTVGPIGGPDDQVTVIASWRNLNHLLVLKTWAILLSFIICQLLMLLYLRSLWWERLWEAEGEVSCLPHLNFTLIAERGAVLQSYPIRKYFVHWYNHPHAPLVGTAHTPSPDIPHPPFSFLPVGSAVLFLF